MVIEARRALVSADPARTLLLERDSRVAVVTSRLACEQLVGGSESKCSSKSRYSA